jgi:DNA-binding IclR family transcriptional regulator
MSVLKFLASRARPVPSMMIARHLDLPKSSTYHLLNVMRQQNFVTYYARSHAWGLGPLAFEIGTAYSRIESLTWLARTRLRDFADDVGVTTHLGVLYGQDVMYVVKETPSHARSRLVSEVGVRLPAHLTAVGSAILMHLSSSQLRALYPLTSNLVRRTRRGPVLLSHLEHELREARARGNAIDDGMTTPGITCIAGTVFSHERVPVAGVGVTFASGQLGIPSRSELASRIVQLATELSISLGWEREAPPEPSREGAVAVLAPW